MANNDMLERRGLLRIFNKYKEYKMIAICAPAGYGKTTAMMQWLKKDMRAKAIFTIDEYDNNIHGFCKRFCAALQVCQPKNQTLNAIINDSSFQNTPDEFSLRALSALSNRKQAVIAIDDLHLLNDAMLQLLLVFLKRLPNNFQIILVSRYELPPGLSELWLNKQCALLNTEHLLFSKKEIMALYKKQDKLIMNEQAENVYRQTHGWVIGINAFLLSEEHKTVQTNSYLEQYFRLNIWNKLDKPTRDFMLHTAIAEILNHSLCDLLTNRSDSSEFLEKLAREGAFVIRHENGNYSYQHLFQQFIKTIGQKKGEKFLSSLLIKEGEWHLSRNDFYNAIECFIKCKNHTLIAKCFSLPESSVRATILSHSFALIIKHPAVEFAIKKFPHLLFILICRAFSERCKNEMISYMDEYYAKHPEIVTKYPLLAYKIFYTRMADFRFSINSIMDDDSTLRKIESKKLSKIQNTVQLSSSLFRRMAFLQTPIFHRGLRDFSDMALGDIIKNVDMLFSKYDWGFGEELPMVNKVLTAGLFYEKGFVEEANNCAMTAIAEVKDHFSINIIFCAFSIYICTLDALDKYHSEDTKTALETIGKMINSNNNDYYSARALSAFIMRRAIISGDINTAVDWLNNENSEEPILFGSYFDITKSRALIITQQYDFAIILLKKVLKFAEEFKRPLDMIEANNLLAIAYWKKKRSFQKKALEHLETAIWLAQTFGFIQLFINDGAELAGMLHKLINRVKQKNKNEDKPLSFVNYLYLKTRDKANLINEHSDSTVSFTKKQISIMNLLCQGKTYDDIMKALEIKRPTLRSHLKLIYDKLEVTNKGDAITKINSMHLEI